MACLREIQPHAARGTLGGVVVFWPRKSSAISDAIPVVLCVDQVRQNLPFDFSAQTNWSRRWRC